MSTLAKSFQDITLEAIQKTINQHCAGKIGEVTAYNRVNGTIKHAEAYRIHLEKAKELSDEIRELEHRLTELRAEAEKTTKAANTAFFELNSYINIP